MNSKYFIRLFNLILEIVAWINIAFAVSIILAAPFYFIFRGKVHLSLIIIPSALVGIFAAEKVRRKYGCSTIIFRVRSSPDLDKKNE